MAENFNLETNDEYDNFEVEFGEVTRIGEGTSDFNALNNRPKYNDAVMTGETNIPEVPSALSQLTNDLDFQTGEEVDSTVTSAVAGEAAIRQQADNNLQSQIDAITVSSDVVDVLGTYAELQAYDTSHIKANDIIKVIQDSTHNNAMSYYRWVITNNVGAWSYVGSEGPFYTKSETDTLLNAKANTSDIIVYTAGTGISIQNGVISLSLTSAESESF